jgi:tripartite-type tricarboxylate transporter receptor subunit TctC
MKNALFATRGVLVASLGFGGAARAADDDVAAFYKDKQIRMVVGSAAGSGYDIGARLVARYMTNYIPGHPTFIIQNQPGAASVLMTNSLYNVAPKDGTVIGAAINGMPTAPLLEPEGARFDPTKLAWLGSVNREVQVTYVWHTAPALKLTDLYDRELIVGATAPGTTQVDFPVVARAILGLKYKVISGYEGTAQIHKAMETGEVHGVGSTALASLRALAQNWLDEGKVKVIAQWGLRRHKDLPDTPAILDLVKTDADRQAMTLMMARLEYGRPFFAPPGVPPDRMAALVKAFDQTMADPAFVAEAQKLNLEVEPVSGAEVSKLVRDVNATSPDVIKRVRDALKGR